MYLLRQINVQGKGTAYHLIDAKENRPVALLTNTKVTSPMTLVSIEDKASGFELIRLQDQQRLEGLWDFSVRSPAEILNQINSKHVDVRTIQQRPSTCVLQYRTLYGLSLYLATDSMSGGWDYFTDQRSSAKEFTLEDAIARADWDKPQANTTIPGDMVISVDVVASSGIEVFKRRKYSDAPIRYKDESDFEVVKASSKLIAVFREALEEADDKQPKANPYRVGTSQFTAYELGWSDYAHPYNERMHEAGL